jgi:hypothetical protein
VGRRRGESRRRLGKNEGEMRSKKRRRRERG